MKSKRVLSVALCQAVATLAGFLTGCSSKPQETVGGAEPLRAVRFANLPYADHTYSSIGVAKGWFREVGIDLKAETIKVEEAVPSLTSGAFDVVSVPPGILFSAYDAAQNLCTFVFGDLFQGYALMAQPGQGYKTYAEFTAQGMGHADAVKAVVRQLKGKTFAYPTENAIKPFIDLLLENGGLTRDQIKALVLDDPMTVNAMRNKQADFQVGGVPSRIVLQKEGFIPLISSIDLAKWAKPSANSKELASILQNGWATRKDFYEKDPATVLRMASVNYRIMRFIETNREEALAIHMAYLSKVTGQKFTPADGAVIYDYLDPFVTFDKQRPWFHDESDPLYYQHVNGAILRSFIEDKIYKGTPPAVDDVIFADDTYRELERLRQAARGLFSKLDARSHLPQSVSRKLMEARRFFDAYDYYDAERLAFDALKEVGGQ